MPDHHDAQDYTANGPTAVGFKTGGDGTGIANGVVAEGTEYGVHGKGLGTEGASTETTGVFGESIPGYGVKGISTNFPGVFGRSDHDAGVQGVGTDVGVRGEGKTGVFGRGENTGVQGNCENGIGVDGHSTKGAGLHGSSNQGRGGVFESRGLFAQARLIPCVQSTEEPQLSKNGQVGDLFLIRHNGTRGGKERFDRCTLWLCVPENPSRDESSQWQEVMLGGITTGKG